MKIGEFASMNGVTAKLLRHYDEIGLLRPACIDSENGYRTYESSQGQALNWILILRALGFALGDIRDMLNGPVDSERFIRELIRHRTMIREGLEEQIQKKVLIDRLILLVEKEGFDMSRTIDLMRFEEHSVHEIKKNMPNMEAFLDEARLIHHRCEDMDALAVLIFDISRFKRVNDTHGFVVGDRVILACHDALHEAIADLGADATLGRAHGDEFAVFARADGKKMGMVAEQFLSSLAAFDWKAIGCGFPVTGKVGIVCSRKDRVDDLRKIIDMAYEPLQKAERKGPGNFVMESLSEQN